MVLILDVPSLLEEGAAAGARPGLPAPEAPGA
jgi:hypothetical protein